ncbi:MAG: cytochrome c oxidase subunit [Frankiaceae bacterium]|nr:cytochrome c oxidase subunit [Frankiaceae bacterium]
MTGTSRRLDGDRPRGTRRRGRGLRVGILGASVLLTATACELHSFGMPHGITPQATRIYNIWSGSTIAALGVGVFVWGLILFASFFYRKKTDELPEQVRYNLPVEVLYTMVPFVIVAGLFYFTARDEIQINKTTPHPDVTISVIGFRWQWQFGYVEDGRVIGQVTGRPGETPVLVLPTDRSIRFVESSPDVIHSFWVPEFLFKRDVIPGKLNQFEISKIDRTGTFVGRCAEFCGTDHPRMNFTVKVVEPAEYDALIQSFRTSAASQAAPPAPLAAGNGQ